MNYKLYWFPASVLLLIALCSCSGNDASITGQSIGLESKKVRLEEILPDGYNIVDSTFTDLQGNYRFRVALPDSQPTLYNLRFDDEVIPLLISPGERIELFSVLGNVRNYQVAGSIESSLVKEVNDILQSGAARLDSMADAHSLHSDHGETDRRESMREYIREYHNIKKAHIRFIIQNNGRLAAIYALQQRLPGDPTLFNGDTDIVFYRMVADSAAKYHPGSRYLLMLQNALATAGADAEHIAALRESMQSPVPFPDITLPDIYGNKHKLSDNMGRVILLDFWSADEAAAAMLNAEYKEIYGELADSGFMIYQVNLGTSKPAWVNAVLDQGLPWISVSDLKGMASPVTSSYNIGNVPSNYLINTAGDIVGKNVFGNELRQKATVLVRDAGSAK